MALLLAFAHHTRAQASTSAPTTVKLSHMGAPGMQLHYRMKMKMRTHWLKSGKSSEESLPVEFMLTGENPNALCPIRWSLHIDSADYPKPRTTEDADNPDARFHQMERDLFHEGLTSYTFSFCVSAAGRVSHMIAQREVPEPLEHPDQQAFAHSMLAGSNEGRFIESFVYPILNTLVLQYPDAPVPVGASWKEALRHELFDPFAYTEEIRTLTLLSAAPGAMTLACKAAVNPAPGGATVAHNAAAEAGEGSGTATIDSTTGLVTKGHWSLVLHLSNELPPEIAIHMPADAQTGKYDVTHDISIERH